MQLGAPLPRKAPVRSLSNEHVREPECVLAREVGPLLSDLVGELSTRSEEFRQLWARHDVRFHISGTKRFHHAQVGDLKLNYERLEVVFDTDLTIFAYTAEPGTRSADALSLLGSLAATTDAERASAAP